MVNVNVYITDSKNILTGKWSHMPDASNKREAMPILYDENLVIQSVTEIEKQYFHYGVLIFIGLWHW